MQKLGITSVFTRRWCRESCTRHGLRVYIFLLDALAIRFGAIIDSATAHRSREMLTIGVCRHLLSCDYENIDESSTPRTCIRRRANPQTTLTSTSDLCGKNVSMRRTSSVERESSVISVWNTSASDMLVRHIA